MVTDAEDEVSPLLMEVPEKSVILKNAPFWVFSKT